MSKQLKIVSVIVIVAALLVVVGVVAAQGNGNVNRGGNGNGNGNANQNGNGICDPAGCVNDPQNNAYQYGGQGFGNRWTDEDGNGNGQSRGGMYGPGPNGGGFYANLPPAFESELPQDVVDLMVSGWLDEQNAYEIYGGVIEQFGEVRPFVNIQKAEAQHIAAWEYLFSRYDIAVPEVPAADVPEFASLAEACQISADAEVANFGLYDTMLAAFEAYPDLSQVTLTLRNASEFSHLPAFQNCAGW